MTDEKTTKELSEELLSGYIDGALVQQDEQRVRIHLENSAEARELVAQMRQMREAAMKTEFSEATDLQWSEKAKSPVSSLSRGLGFLLFILWGIGLLGLGLWEVARGSESLLGKLLVFGLVSGLALLLLSVFLDRRRDAKHDPYKGVEK